MTDGAIRLFESNVIEELSLCLQRLLEYCTDDTIEDRYDYSDLEYFICEQEFGKKGDEYSVTDVDGTEHKIHNIDELWEYIAKTRPHVIDKTGKDNLDKADEDCGTKDTAECIKEFLKRLKEN